MYSRYSLGSFGLVKGRKNPPVLKTSLLGRKVYGKGPEVEAKMQKVFQAKTDGWESPQHEDVRSFGFSIRLFLNSLGLSIHSLFL